MTIIRITKEFRFEAAHMLKDYDGLCINTHGHSYKLVVTIAGKINEDIKDPKLGMLMDFGELKKIIFDEIINKFDHALIVNNAESEETKDKMRNITKRLIFTSYQPTCENLANAFAGIIKKRLPSDIRLHHLRLNETPTSYAEWFQSDNN